MDIHCRHCGEPWDHDELHEIEGHTYKQAAGAFKKYGCGAFVVKETCRNEPIYPPEMLELIAVSQDMSPYPDEWESPEDIAFMLELADGMF
jgi:hypothetical protein